MRVVTSVVLALFLKESEAFSIQSNTATSINTRTRTSLHQSLNNNDENNSQKNHGIKSYGQLLLVRSDTMKAAGFHDISEGSENKHLPLEAGARTNITLFLVALGYKYYRSIFINKLAIWERQPQWNTVITSKEDEEKANLEAMTCNECGSIIFIAKGRKWFQMPNGYKCYCCGATGEEAFANTREDLLEEIDDDYFDYEKPLDFVTAAERRKLMKQAGGDESKANDLLTQGAKDPNSEAGADAPGGDDEAPKKKKKKKKKGKKKKKKVEEGETTATQTKAETKADESVKKSDDADDADDLDVLGMD